MSTHYDAIIVGAGQCGVPLALALDSAGKKVALVEREHIGGTCVNTGCTPTKTMIASGRVAYLSRRSKDYGVEHGEIKVSMEGVRERKRDIVDQWRSGSERRLASSKVDVIKGEARFENAKSLLVKLGDGQAEKKMTADSILLDVGERPAGANGVHLDVAKFKKGVMLDSTSIMELDEVPKHLIVLGGGYIGLEFGQLFRRLGAQVTVIQRGAQLVPREDLDVAQALLEILHEDGINVQLSATVTDISPQKDEHAPISVVVASDGKDTEVRGSHLLLATGRVPNTDTLNLQAAGVKTDKRGYIEVDEKFQTNIPGIYGLGDCHGGPAFTHMSYDDFRIIRANLIPEATPSTTPAMRTTFASKSRNLVPYVMYTDPQLAHVGVHEKDLEVSGRKYKTAKMPMSYVARAAETDEKRGLMKATVDAETGEILGFTCLGIEGGELMAVVQTAMMGGLKWWDLEAAVWAHPSLAESLNNLWGHFE